MAELPLVHLMQSGWPEGPPGAVVDWLHQYRDRLLGEAAECGAVLLRGLGLGGPTGFEPAARALLGELSSYRGGDSPRQRLAPGVYTSTSLPGDREIPLHNEMSYSNAHPAHVLFFCESPALRGGATPLLDGRWLLHHVPERLARRAREVGLRYVQRMPDGRGLGKPWQATFETDDRHKVEGLLERREVEFEWRPDGSLVTAEIVSPVVRHPLTGAEAWFSQLDQWHASMIDRETQELIEELGELRYHDVYYGDGAVIDAAEVARLRAVARSRQVVIPWEQGDILLIDNLVTLHGRQPFEGNGRRVLVAMA